MINCAALSSPKDCEDRPEAAKGLNVPRALLDWLTANRTSDKPEPLLIHLSTDQGTSFVWQSYGTVQYGTAWNLYVWKVRTWYIGLRYGTVW